MFGKAIMIKILKSQWIQHLGFWVLSFYILLNVFRLSYDIQKIDLIYTALFMVNIFGLVYVNLKILIPRFLARKKYMWYAVLGFLNLLLFSDLNIWLFNYFVDFLLPGYYFISYYELEDILKFHLAFLVLTTLFKLSKAWFKMQEAEKKIARVHEEKTSAELNALKSQINPHFLFNSLSNIHSLSLKKSEKTSASVLLLSDMMRYVLYETAVDFVKLSDEIKFLNNLVELQRLRLQQESEIIFTTEIENPKLIISPLILLPFLENSFKHGLKGDTGKTYAYFRLSTNGDQLNFLARNNKVAEKDEGSGFGLKNVKRRLELLYPEKHELVIKDEDDIFEISLKLSLHEQE